jgi:hypothetical protein
LSTPFIYAAGTYDRVRGNGGGAACLETIREEKMDDKDGTVEEIITPFATMDA